jgi:two-component system nitrate/nitrite response regulator NarL
LDAAGRCIPELISLIREQVPGSAVLVLAQDDEPELVCRSLRSGVNGYVVKEDQARSLPELLSAVWSGHLPVSPGVARLILAQFRGMQPRKSLYDLNLSPRQREVMDQICKGWTNKEIAAELGISTDAVKLHVKAVKRKMGVHSRTQISGWGGRSTSISPNG